MTGPRPEPETGAELVRYNFNPSGLPEVHKIKTMAADLIDYLRTCDGDGREISIAITHIQTAAMFAVGAVTKNKSASTV